VLPELYITYKIKNIKIFIYEPPETGANLDSRSEFSIQKSLDCACSHRHHKWSHMQKGRNPFQKEVATTR
jgi:hypothetical protein